MAVAVGVGTRANGFKGEVDGGREHSAACGRRRRDGTSLLRWGRRESGSWGVSAWVVPAWEEARWSDNDR